MHINFTPRAQQVLALAKNEAKQLHHSYIGTEHLLLALIKLGQGVALNALDAKNLGAKILTRTKVIEAKRAKGFWKIIVENQITHEVEEHHAAVGGVGEDVGGIDFGSHDEGDGEVGAGEESKVDLAGGEVVVVSVSGSVVQ